MDIKKLLKKMTLDQKIAQLCQFNARCLLPDVTGEITGPAKALDLTKEDIAYCGSTLTFADANSMIEVQKKHLELDPNKIPLLFMHDVIHGYRTLYPIQLALGASWDADIVKECSRMSARESAAGGVHVTFSPMVDLVRDARWGRCMESCGEDPYLNSVMARAQVEGFQGNLDSDEDICACVKHFAAYGAAEGGRDYNTVDMSEYNLRENYLAAYKSAVEAGAQMIMASFNTINGVPAIANKWLLKDVLRDEWGFDKPVISDYAAFAELTAHGYSPDDKESARLALNATADIEMMSTCYLKNLRALVEEGKVSEEQIDESVLRILELKDKLGLFENPYRYANPEKEKALALCPEHRAIARKAAQKCAVLLKNDDILPFDKNIKNIAVIGPWSDVGMIGEWPGHGEPEEAVTVIEGIKNALASSNVTMAKGCEGVLNELPDDKRINEAVKTAKEADAVILCVGEHSKQSGEAHSRADINLSPAQARLVKEVCSANKNTVCVLFCGRPIVLTDIIDTVPAIFVAWQPGTEGGNAIADLIFGNVNFEGRLPMTFPLCVGQVPIYYSQMSTGRPQLQPDQIYCSRYIDCPNEPLFPFGYGLSYTSFEISSPVLSQAQMDKNDTVVVSAKVKNTGGVSGKAVVQLYIRDLFASRTRPVKELKGFTKVALEAGEEKEVSFEITEKDLAFYGASGNFEAEAGDFHIFLALDSTSKDFVTLNLK
ncbi:MAG: beta-glucosidase BglX [Clostridia bacterium]|nr:beta-glucosidase BglX [Clostridia bacterium]